MNVRERRRECAASGESRAIGASGGRRESVKGACIVMGVLNCKIPPPQPRTTTRTRAPPPTPHTTHREIKQAAPLSAHTHFVTPYTPWLTVLSHARMKNSGDWSQ